MNNIKKIGLTALAGSLVTLGSAQAGEMSVSGGINTTLKFGKGGGNTGRTIGADRDFTFSGGGELDNGTTFTMSTTSEDALGLSSSTTTITTPSLGSFQVGSGTGSAAGSYDEEVPQAYEQISDAKQNMANQVGDFMDNNHVMYTSPTLELMGASITGHLGYSPQATDSYTSTGDGGQTTYSATIGEGKEAGITIAYEGLKVGFYGAERDRTMPEALSGTGNYQHDEFNGAWYAKYSMGPVSIGYSEFYMDAGVTLANETVNAAKTRRAVGGIYTSESMSIAFNVNDNLSVSYAKAEDTYDAQGGSTAGAVTGDAVADVSMDMKSIQAAYSMGAMSIKAYRTETDNAAYSTTGGSLTVNEVALGLSF